MNFNVEEVLKSDAFTSLDPELIILLKNVMLEIQGKSATESMPIVLNFLTTIPRHIVITKQQETEIINAIMQNLSPVDQSKIRVMLKVMGIVK